jgi:hypothetical protein
MKRNEGVVDRGLRAAFEEFTGTLAACGGPDRGRQDAR